MSIRVLIVDDSPAMRAFVRRVIQISGIDAGEYLEAADGCAALDVLGARPVDLVLADVNMPGMDGPEFVRRLAADPKLSTVPVLIISSDGTPERRQQLATLGVRGYLAKPFTPEALRAGIETVMGHAHG